MGLTSSTKRFLPSNWFMYILVLCSILNSFTSPANSQALIQLGEQIPVRDVDFINGIIWVANESGLYYVSDENLIDQFTQVDVSCIEKVGGEIWFGTSAGVFRVVGQSYERVELNEVDSLNVLFLIFEADDESVWLGTNRGIYRKTLGDFGPLELLTEQEPVYMAIIEGELWAGMYDDIYRFDRSLGDFIVLSKNFEVPRVIEIVVLGDDVFLRTSGMYGGFLYVYRYQAISQPSIKFVYDIAQVGDELWFSSRSGVARASEGRIREVYGLDEVGAPVNGIAEISDFVWIGTTDGVYRRQRASDGMFHRLASNDVSPSVSRFAEMDGLVWAWGQSGVYRVVEDADMGLGGMPLYVVLITVVVVACVLVLLRRRFPRKKPVRRSVIVQSSPRRDDTG